MNQSREHIPTVKEIGDYVLALWAQQDKSRAVPSVKSSTTMPEDRTVSHQAVKPAIAPPEPNYPPPKGPLVRFDMQAEAPSMSMCQGMSDAKQIQCLCPSPLTYTLSALAAPSDNNYSTEIKVKKADRSFYRIRVFARTVMVARYGWSMNPPFNQSIAALGLMDYDPYSFTFTSTAPENEFKIEVHSSEGLRLKCVNQEN
ncbi:MAG TPA: hypothetical protein VKG86_12170 [Terracidiphilus sp.]|nr:hypothetical protein [Terracidiphilus sp.]